MARSAVPLTDARIRQVLAADKPFKLADGGGMYLLVRPDGARYWRLDYRFGDKRKTLALGVYPEVDLEEARRRRSAAKIRLIEGVDPAAFKKAGKTAPEPPDRFDYPYLAHALAVIGEGVWDWGLADGKVRHNAQWARLMGLGEGAAQHDWSEALARVHPHDREQVMAAIRVCLDGEAAFECEHRVCHADGNWLWVLSRGEIVARSADGLPLRMVGCIRDITEQKRSALILQRRNRLLQLIATVSELLMEDRPEQELMAAFCHELVRGRIFDAAWLDLSDDGGHGLRQVASAGAVPASSGKSAPAVAAIGNGSTSVAANGADDPRPDAGSAAATPLRRHGRVVGALSVYAGEARAFSPDIVMLLEKLTADLGLALDHRAAVTALRESEARHRLISSVATDLLYSCLRDDDGFHAIEWATASVERTFGYTLGDILAAGNWRGYVHPDDLPTFDRDITYLAPGQRSECELRVVGEDAAIHYVRACSIAERAAGAGARPRLYGACQDITERRRAEEALRESETRFRALAEQSADWIWSADLQGRYLYANRRGAANLGYTVDEFRELGIGLVHPDDLPLLRETWAHAIANREGWQSVILRWRHRGGHYRSLESNASPRLDDGGQLIGFQGVDRDITERRQAEAQIEFLAHHDALTGLPNRILLRDRFKHALLLADRSSARVALLFLDLDNFKVVNDSLGHAAGDALLMAVVARLSACLRESDTISRQGGDEFILLLNDIPQLDVVERIASNIINKLSEPIEINGHYLNASCSIGVAVYPGDGRDFDSLLQKADTAMYGAKDAGRGTFRFFDETMNAQARDHLLLQNRLHQALLHGEFQLHYQPQINADNGRVIGVEALLRWHNPELGDVAPARFIPVAEDCGLIVPIGVWVLGEACRQAQAWHQAGWHALTMSVNLSALQLRRADLVDIVAAALTQSGLPPVLLELELTESILLQDIANTFETVHRLKALGVRLSIDDFGTGYSSLSYLKRFDVDRLKIDQSFVRDINHDPDDDAIVLAIIQLARSLRLGIIAEGVETPAQLDFLRQAGCHQMQGYLFSRPLPAPALEAFLREQKPAEAGG